MPKPKREHRLSDPKPKLPAPTDWRTTDEDELLKRRIRAAEETFRISNLDPAHPVFSNFEVCSSSGMTYHAEIRDIATRQFSCTCTDFRINGLGTCKHIEAVLLRIGRQHRAQFKAAQTVRSPRIDIVPDREAGVLSVERNFTSLPASLRGWFRDDGRQREGVETRDLLAAVEKSRFQRLRISQDVAPWLESRAREAERLQARRDYELGVQEGRHPEHVTKSPLFPYQREGMMHLAFTERALLADEMGLGKTIQAIAACALLRHLGLARRVLVVAPASLKAEWEEQIHRFTNLPLRLVFGGRTLRVAAYDDPNPPFFTIANYEQILSDSLDINEHLRPDVVVLDEAQRIKNWSTKTAQAVKRLRSRYAFVLTGTPIENRIDELRSLVDFLDPALLGPLFRFNREYYQLDERGRPESYKNLERLRERVRPILLRRRKVDVETELPDRTDHTHFVALTPTMRDEYAGYEKTVAELTAIAKRRPLTPREQDMLMICLNCMRMICDSPGIIKKNPSKECPKMDELARVLDELLSDDDVKVIIFSEWEGMLQMVRHWAEKNRVGFAWHTGTVPQKRRRAEIIAFREDPGCRLFLSTDSGGVGLNLQNASAVINCDLPWNPAKLEQRIARAWRKGQRRAVTVINLVAESTIEHGMLESLARKSELARGVLDGGSLEDIKLKSGNQAFLKRLEQIMAKVPAGTPAVPAPPSDPAAHFAAAALRKFGGRLTSCEECWLPGSDEPVIVAVLRDQVAGQAPALEELFKDSGWTGKPPTLHVLDITAWNAIQNLAATGMITIHYRAKRPLLPEPSRHVLTPEELEKIRTLRALADQKHRAARALIAAGFPDEAAPLTAAAESAESEAATIEGGG